MNNENFNTTIKSLFEIHKKSLLLKYHQSTYMDDYNRLVLDDFVSELEYFLHTIIVPALKMKMIRYEGKGSQAIHLLLELVRIELLNGSDIIDEKEVITGEDYERFVGKNIKDLGWRIRFTPTTGDQGIDIIALKDNKTVAIQCKYYQGSVGNSAIQEAYSGSRFYEADTAMVISSGKFTKSARQLASSLNVMCLHHDNIHEFFSPRADSKNPTAFFSALTSEAEEERKQNPLISDDQDADEAEDQIELDDNSDEKSLERYEQLIEQTKDPAAYYQAAHILMDITNEGTYNLDKAFVYYITAYEGGIWYATANITLVMLVNKTHLINDLSSMNEKQFAQAITKYIVEYGQSFKDEISLNPDITADILDPKLWEICSSLSTLCLTFEILEAEDIINPLQFDRAFLDTADTFIKSTEENQNALFSGQASDLLEALSKHF